VAHITRYRRNVDGKSVVVKAHERRVSDKGGRNSQKVHITKDFIRMRLRSPASLKRRGFTRIRTMNPDGKLPGLNADMAALVRRENGQVVMYFKGNEGRPQAVLIPRKVKR